MLLGEIMNKNVVFIPFIETGDGRSNPYEFSIKSWKYWCKKNDCDLVIDASPGGFGFKNKVKFSHH